MNYSITTYPQRRSESSDKPQKSYHFCFITYATPCELINALAHFTDVSRYLGIYHDKDIKEDGSPKEPHYHVIVTFKCQHYESGLFRLLQSKEWRDLSPSNTLVEIIKDKCQAYLYLTHETERAIAEGKIRYDRSSFVSNDFPYYAKWDICDDADEKSNEQFVADLLSLNPFDMALKWGRDYLRYYERYTHFIAFALNNLTPEQIEKLPTSIKEKIR